MRAKIASRAKGHVFEERFMDLSGLQLIIAYRQAIKEEQREFDMLGETLQAAFKRFDRYFEDLSIYTNPELWKAMQDQKELQTMRNQINEDNFEDEWAKVMNFAPATVVAVEEKPDIASSSLPKLDPKVQEFLTGFLPKGKKQPKEGG